ncbi:MAG TPA: PQQ-dependent sugar dehydrogenase, partial [Rhizobacter sp.]|nr:PQQ-dependent sugar dehydrogenase [Rhizobacter sp.]
MSGATRGVALRAAYVLVALTLASCGGGGGGGSDAPPPPLPPNQAPLAVIGSPAAGSSFRAGDTLVVTVSATDPEDGALAPAQLTWWAEMHHDTHSHPFQPETIGAGGSVSVPTRGETSANIFYRFHLRATDSAGATHETTRDIAPQTAQVTLATLPTGLALTLDGQPVTGPTAFTGVVGLERDLVAPPVQDFGGRRYQFASWSSGRSATHTLSTPASDTTYTASYTDIGPAQNTPPSVALTAPLAGASVVAGATVPLSATASDSDGLVTGVEFFANGVKVGATDTAPPYAVAWVPAASGAVTLTARATDNAGAATSSAAVGVTVTPATGGDTQAPVATLTAPAHLASGLAGVLTLSATATDNVGVTGVDFQVDGVPVGATDTTAPYSVQLDSTLYASGQHVVRARARDAAGNLSPWASATVEFAGTRAEPAGFTHVENWVNGLGDTTAFTQAPDGRFFVAEQAGSLRVVTPQGTLLPTPFITLPVDPTGERGLIGVALHPNFASNRYLYLHYTTTENGTHNRVSRFTANASNPNVVQTGSELRIADLPALSPAVNHNGGALQFGNDGKLYVAVGDNSDGSKSPDLNDPMGKMLRFNDDGSIPSDNPFCTTPATLRCAIWARGLRNPFSFAVRPSDGRMHINDVGSLTWEEINVGAAGANYGWPSTEGPTTAAGITSPLFAYDHDAAPNGMGGFFTGCVISAGNFYPEAGRFPVGYRGGYYFADGCSLVIGRLDL